MIEHLAVSGSFWFLSLFSLEAKQAEDYMQVFVLHTVMPILDDIWIALVLVFHICCPCLLRCTNIFVAIRQQRVPALFIFIFPSFFLDQVRREKNDENGGFKIFGTNFEVLSIRVYIRMGRTVDVVIALGL